MKKQILFLIATGILAACSGQTTEEKIKQQMTDKQYPLTADERSKASIAAKSYFEKLWLIADNKPGQLNNCNPTDSNANGLVSCTGSVPQPAGAKTPYLDVKMFCSYRPEVTGCNPEDKVQ